MENSLDFIGYHVIKDSSYGYDVDFDDASALAMNQFLHNVIQQVSKGKDVEVQTIITVDFNPRNDNIKLGSLTTFNALKENV